MKETGSLCGSGLPGRGMGMRRPAIALILLTLAGCGSLETGRATAPRPEAAAPRADGLASEPAARRGGVAGRGDGPRLVASDAAPDAIPVEWEGVSWQLRADAEGAAAGTGPSAATDEAPDRLPPWRDEEAKSIDEYFDVHYQPAPLDPIMDPINPGRALYAVEKALGVAPSIYSSRPAPHLPEPLFFELMRPLAKLKYDAEFNHLLVATDDDALAEQILEFEIMVADWHAAEVAATVVDGEFKEWLLGYTWTLGVGQGLNWAQALWLQAPIGYFDNDVVGLRPLYVFAWRPHKDHPFAWFQASGAERIAVPEDDGTGHKGIWRPMFVFGPFYSLKENFTVGVETNVRIDDEHGFYLALPQISWRPIEHLAIKAGAGYLRESGHDAATAMLRLFWEWPSPRKPCTAEDNPRPCDYGWQGGFGWLLDLFD